MNVLLLALSLLGAVDPKLVGQWSGPGGLSFVVQANGVCTLDVDAGTCRTQGSTVFFTGDGETEALQYRLSGNALVLTDAMGEQLSFSRAGSKPAPPTDRAAPAPAWDPAGAETAPSSTSSLPVAAAPKGSGGPGSPFAKKAWGTSFTVPAGWKAGEKEGLVLVGSDTEAGLIVVRFYPKVTRAELEQGFQQGFHDNGMNAMPSTSLVAFKAKGGAGLAGDLSGADAQGNALQVRTVAVSTRWGGALVVAGLTTPPQFATLKARTDALAQSATFTEPPKGGALAGDYQFVYVSRDGQYSRESRITLCQSGSFTKSGEMAGSGSSGQAFVGSHNGGTWTAAGDASGGTLTLTYGDGSTESFEYAASTNPADMGGYGPAVRIGSTLYQKAGPGGC